MASFQQLSLFPVAEQINKPLKWAGAKTHLIDKMRSLYSPEHRWVDLFCGSLALPLALKPKQAMLIDVNRYLINFWCWVQSDGVVRYTKFINTPEHYAQCRDRFNELARLGDPRENDRCEPELAELFYYLNRTGWRGLCRFSKSTGFNVPYGQEYRSKVIPYRYEFTDIKEAIAEWDFLCADFRRIPVLLEPSDFVYADPPYWKTFAKYSAGGFNWNDHEALAAILAKCDRCVASNSWESDVIALYRKHGFSVEAVRAPRMIDCKGDRGSVPELLAVKL